MKMLGMAANILPACRHRRMRYSEALSFHHAISGLCHARLPDLLPY